MTLDQLVLDCGKTAYVEEPSDTHTEMTAAAWARVLPQMADIDKSLPVLDIGCGKGVAIQHFIDAGIEQVCALTAVAEEADAIMEKFPFWRYKVLTYCADMHVASFQQRFGLIWARHVLEHSPVPFFMLKKIFDNLAVGGYCYIEVPAPGTSARHEINENHWSVLGAMAWEQLFCRTGFGLVDRFQFNHTPPCGNDTYLCWLVQRPKE